MIKSPALKTFGLLCLWWPALVVAKSSLPTAFVSIPPQAWILEQLVGERWRIQTMLGPNANPHNYDPVPRQLVSLADADVYFTIGVPFEAMWRQRIANVNPEMTFVHCGSDNHEAHTHDHDGHEGMDPHVWTSPLETSAIAECMSNALGRHDSDGRQYYQRNLQELQQRLRQLDESIRQTLADVRPRYMLVQHPAWGHFAHTYDLKQLAIEKDGHEPNARHLVKVIERANQLGLNTVLVQRQYSPAAARLVAREIHGRIVEIDPMAPDLIATLERLTQLLAESSP